MSQAPKEQWIAFGDTVAQKRQRRERIEALQEDEYRQGVRLYPDSGSQTLS